MRILPLLLLLVACAPQEEPPPPPTPPDPTGDWAGWIYLDEGGDLPVRVSVEEAQRATLDLVPNRAYGLEIQSVVWTEPVLRLERTNDAGSVIAIEGTIDGDTLDGRFYVGEREGDIQLHRSIEPLPDIDPDSYADCQGSYRDAQTTVVIGSRFWGELQYTVLESGRHGTLFPTGEDAFFAGSAAYVPDRVDFRARCLRDDAGAVTALEWNGTRLERQALIEEALSFDSDGTRLAGTLLRPDGPGPHPAIVVLGGSNWDTRDSVRRDAEIYAALGLAAFVYDKRGYGESQGERTVPFATIADDTVAAVRLLEARDDIVGNRIGIHGRSRSSWFAPLAASRAPDAIDFLVLFVPPSTSPAVQETTSRTHYLRDRDHDEATIELAREVLELSWEYGRSGEGWERYSEARRAAIEAGVPDAILESDVEDPEHWDWVRLNMDYDPLPALRSVRCPTLAVFAEADRKVDLDENLPPLRAALSDGDLTVVVVPGADHSLRAVPADERELPLHRRSGFGPAGWSAVRAWLDEKL